MPLQYTCLQHVQAGAYACTQIIKDTKTSLISEMHMYAFACTDTEPYMRLKVAVGKP